MKKIIGMDDLSKEKRLEVSAEFYQSKKKNFDLLKKEIQELFHPSDIMWLSINALMHEYFCMESIMKDVRKDGYSFADLCREIQKMNRRNNNAL